MSPFVAMTNIENFNKGIQDYGVDRESEFQSGDLWEVRKGPFLNVINCISSLGFVVSVVYMQIKSIFETQNSNKSPKSLYLNYNQLKVEFKPV